MIAGKGILVFIRISAPLADRIMWTHGICQMQDRAKRMLMERKMTNILKAMNDYDERKKERDLAKYLLFVLLLIILYFLF